LTAWQFINFAAELGEDSNLTRTAALMEELGLDVTLDQPFSGTLLLPNNAVRNGTNRLLRIQQGSEHAVCLTLLQQRQQEQRCWQQHGFL
jgi:hypothetical protein